MFGLVRLKQLKLMYSLTTTPIIPPLEIKIVMTLNFTIHFSIRFVFNLSTILSFIYISFRSSVVPNTETTLVNSELTCLVIFNNFLFPRRNFGNNSQKPFECLNQSPLGFQLRGLKFIGVSLSCRFQSKPVSLWASLYIINETGYFVAN